VWFLKRKKKPDPADVMREMRERVFSMPPGEIGLEPGPGHRSVWCVLMEMIRPNKAVVSLVTIADGTTSLYFSSGGGIIGAGQHATVREESDRFIALIDEHVEAFAPTEDHPMPEIGRVRFYVRTFDGLRTAEADERELGEQRHSLSPLFLAGHSVIAAVREATPPR
jgi:hypothetical protein